MIRCLCGVCYGWFDWGAHDWGHGKDGGLLVDINRNKNVVVICDHGDGFCAICSLKESFIKKEKEK